MRMQAILSSLFYKGRALICFNDSFFQTGEYSDTLFAHNLDASQHSAVVRQASHTGLVFSASQRGPHLGNLGDCVECLRMYGYVTGFWNHVTGSRLPSPRVRSWKISVSSAARVTSLLNEDVVRGRVIYESSEGKQILEMSGANVSLRPELIRGADVKYIRDLKSVPIYEVSYLAMYDKARRLGFGPDEASEYAFLRGNVYTFASLLALRDDIVTS